MSKAAATDGAPAPKKKSKLLVIILGAVLLLGGAGAGAVVYLKKSHAPAHGAAAKPVDKHVPIFAPLENFTVNLNDPQREHYLQIGLTYEVTGTDVADAIKAQMPLIRSKILLLLTSKTADELASPQGKAKLAGELVALVRAPLANAPMASAQAEDRGVADVHFSSFIIQ